MRKFKLKLLAKWLPIAVVVATTCTMAATPHFSDQNVNSPKDHAAANPERILYWMIKRGELDKDASQAEKDAALSSYLKSATIRPSTSYPLLKRAIPISKNNKQLSTNSPVSNVKTVKVLTVLVDFPDLPYNDNRLTRFDTRMFYSDYNRDHYNKTLFAPSTYPGPSGQALKTVHKYYWTESGNSLSFEGTVFNWVTANSNAATYGANTGIDDFDANAPLLVTEAVTKAVAATTINLTDYDIEDPYDLNGNGIISEPDGFIDHIMVIHSSISEESGGGVLGNDAIWSHYSHVNYTGDASTMGFAIPGTNLRGFSYSIEPIDAGIGVFSHEFGHDLGVPDEYDYKFSTVGDTVGYWSLMSYGSWAGSPIPGSSPISFSPYARELLQSTYGGNWINQQVVDFADLNTTGLDIDIVEATNHSGPVNQIKINIPRSLVDFFPPYSGNYQYYSGEGNSLTNTMSADITIPSASQVQLSMKAHWNTELYTDYILLKINGVAIPGNLTSVNNPHDSTVHDFISGISKSLTGATGPEGWVDLSYDLSAYAGQTVTLSILYSTDSDNYFDGYGFIADDLKIVADGVQFFTDGAEQAGTFAFNGFSRIGSKIPTQEQNYWVQLRSKNSLDSGLTARGYKRGMLLWFADKGYKNNNVAEHPGHGFLAVIDANQTLIKNGAENAPAIIQVKDAPFGLNAENTTALFDDSLDYSRPEQPESGTILPTHGLKIEVISESSTATTATIRVTSTSTQPAVLNSDFTLSSNAYKVFNFTNTTTGGIGNIRYNWDFGEGQSSTATDPVYTYTTPGSFNVVLTATDENNVVKTHTEIITIAEELTAEITNPVTNSAAVVNLTASSQGGVDVTYNWDFGDNQTAIGADVTHTFGLSNTYTVTLTATSTDSQQSVQTFELVVTVPISATISASTNDLSATFSMVIAGGDGNYVFGWEFGDGSDPVNDLSPTHTYASAGTYTAQLQISDAQTQIKIVTLDVTVTAAPVVTPPPVSSGGGGGSTGIVFILLSLLGLQKKYSK